jgi:penicillin G amidase
VLVSALMRRLLTCLLILIFLFASSFAQNASPQPVQIKGLKERVTITRDERGIPYIDAKNDEDLYFAQGYATAADRLWQMDLFRRTARGELAEVLGAGPNNVAVEQDKLHRTYGFAQEAEAEVAQTSAKSRAGLEAYARGVNAYAASLDPKSMPPEFQILNYSFRPWTPADSFIIGKIFSEALSDTWRLDIMRQALSSLPAEKRNALLPEKSPLDVLVVGKDTQARPSSAKLRSNDSLSAEALAALAHNQSVAAAALDRIGFYADELAASNNWVISGSRTVTGKPLLANDPHLRATAPSIWHMVHLSAPGVRVAGITAPGVPGVIIGHNDRIAWGFTNVGPDVQDVYI